MMLYYLLFLIQSYFGLFLLMPLLMWAAYLLLNKKPQPTPSLPGPDYGIIVTAYQITDQLPAVVASILKSTYTNYLVYIVADDCDISALHFSDPRVVILRPPEVLAGNVKSHFYAITHFQRPHSHLTIIDSDNLVDADYLTHLNTWFGRRFEAVQGVRDAKNLDTVLSRLDAARDIYYHYYDGKLLFGLGSSATLAGSGMAFSCELYKACLENRDVNGAGFDKVLQHAIVNSGKRIAFAEQAVVWDQKTSDSGQLVNQRARWINTWFRYFSLGFGLIGKGIWRADWNQLLFGLVLLRPPLFIFILSACLFVLANLLVFPIVSALWLLALVGFVLGFMLALWNSPTDRSIYRALKGIPSFMYFQLVSLAKAKRANEISVATRHKNITNQEET